MHDQQFLQLDELRLCKDEEGWKYLSQGYGFDPDQWVDAANVLGPFGGSGIYSVLDAMADLQAKVDALGDVGQPAEAIKQLPGGLVMPDWSGYRDDLRQELEAALAAAVKPMIDLVSDLQADNEALAANLQGKHALTGATYKHLIAERDRLRQLLDEKMLSPASHAD